MHPDTQLLPLRDPRDLPPDEPREPTSDGADRHPVDGSIWTPNPMFRDFGSSPSSRSFGLKHVGKILFDPSSFSTQTFLLEKEMYQRQITVIVGFNGFRRWRAFFRRDNTFCLSLTQMRSLPALPHFFLTPKDFLF